LSRYKFEFGEDKELDKIRTEVNLKKVLKGCVGSKKSKKGGLYGRR
jgi:hypothetical protein